MIQHYLFDKFEVAAIQRAKRNKPCCGDSFFIEETEDYLICIVADGLGSGQGAKDASQKAVEAVEAYHDLPVEVLMEKVNLSLTGKRGAVVTIFRIEYKKKLITFCGVGNVRFSIYPESGKSITPLSKPGFLTGRPLRFHVQNFHYPDNALFVIHSDGVNILSKQLPEIHRIYSADSPDTSDDYLESLMQITDDDMTLLIGKPM